MESGTLTAATPPSTDRYSADRVDVVMTGVQALVRLPIEVRRADIARGANTAGFISGYEGSPLGGYDMELTRRRDLLDEVDIVFQPGLNEELAATAVQGTQIVADDPDARVDGVTGFWYGKAPGLDRAADALRHANLMGTHPQGGAVAFVGDDPSAKSSTVPSASEGLLADLGMPVLFPADPQDVLDLGHHAVAMSRLSGLWVAMKIATNVADGTGRVRVGAARAEPIDPGMTVDGAPFRHRPGAKMVQPLLAAMESSRDGIRLETARAYTQANRLNRVEDVGAQPRVGIVAAGKTFLDVRHALAILGLGDGGAAGTGIRLLRLAVVHPLVPAEITAFAEGLDLVIVVEEKRSFVEAQIKDILYGSANAPAVVGKMSVAGGTLFPTSGELDADAIASRLARELGARAEFAAGMRPPQPKITATGGRLTLPLLPRTPYFCSGCPHNSSTKVPEGSIVGGGIGCHALVLLMDPRAVGEVTGLTQMGGEGAQWIGMAPFRREQTHLIQNLGDGTFHHSGSLAIRAAVAAGIDVTYKLLYNSTVAMTGGQHPVGAMSVPALTRALAAEGVRRIIVTTDDVRRYRGVRLAPGAQVLPRERLIEAQEELARVPGVTVLIHDQECATELRRKRKRGLVADPTMKVVINERVCEGCGDCGRKSNCLSVQPVATEFGRKTVIDQSSCNVDYSCLAGDCPSFITVTSKGPKTGAARTSSLEEVDLPEPPGGRPAGAEHTTRITGVGGSGVITLSQILVTAAALAGYEASGLDQTGLAQKGGAVVSDITISGRVIERSSKGAAGECDLYLGCDLLVAGDPRQLVVASTDRTRAVVSTTDVPTGAMVVNTAIAFPDVAEVTAQIAAATRSADAVFVDARHLSIALFGSDQFANILLTGIAVQSGALPLPPSAIEQAIELNGVKVELNRQALRRGRQYIADPAGFAAAVAETPAGSATAPVSAAERSLIDAVGADAGSELERLLTVRIPDLVAYQSLAYASSYASFVAGVRAVECEHGLDSEVSEAVARHLYKLMAYKDEYEVARLSLDPGLDAAIRREFGSGARASYRLHPPFLRALGMTRKISLGPWFRPVFAVLRALRRLRGTPFDLFGYAHVRRVERALVEEYRGTIEQLLAVLDADTAHRIADAASLADKVRGYEDIKLASVDAYRAELAAVVADLA